MGDARQVVFASGHRVGGALREALQRGVSLKDIDFVAKRGHVTAVIGEVASGKSTLLLG